MLLCERHCSVLCDWLHGNGGGRPLFQTTTRESDQQHFLFSCVRVSKVPSSWVGVASLSDEQKKWSLPITTAAEWRKCPRDWKSESSCFVATFCAQRVSLGANIRVFRIDGCLAGSALTHQAFNIPSRIPDAAVSNSTNSQSRAETFQHKCAPFCLQPYYSKHNSNLLLGANNSDRASINQ